MIEQLVKNEGVKAGQKIFPKKKLREKKRFYICANNLRMPLTARRFPAQT
jgi:hypothetical protein